MKAEQFLDRWSEISGRAVTEAQRVWAERFCREGSALLEFKPDGSVSYLLLVATDPAKARLLDFVARKAFASDRLEVLWSEGKPLVTGEQLAEMEALGVKAWSIYRILDRKHVGTVYAQLTMVERNRLPSTTSVQVSTGALIRALRRSVDRGDRGRVRDLLAELRGRSLSEEYQHDFLALWADVRLDPVAVAKSERLARVLKENAPGIPVALLEVIGASVLQTELLPVLEKEKGGKIALECVRTGSLAISAALMDKAALLDSSVGAAMRLLASIRDQEFRLLPGDREVLESGPIRVLLEYVPVPQAPDSEAPPSAQISEASARYQLYERAELELKSGGLVCSTVEALAEYLREGEQLAHRFLREWWDQLPLSGKKEAALETPFLRDWIDERVEPEPHAPEDWLSWLSQLQEGSVSLEEGGAGFSYRDLALVRDPVVPAAVKEIGDRLDAIAVEESLVQPVLEVLPEIMAAWGKSELSPSQSRHISSALGHVLQYGLLSSNDALNTYFSDDLLFRYFEVGIGAGSESAMSMDAYQTVVSELAGRVRGLLSPRMLEVLLDLFEFLTDQRRLHGEAFLELARAFISKANQYHLRLAPDSLALIADLAEVSELLVESESLRSLIPEASPAVQEEKEEGVSLAGKRILIYTLVERAGQRAKAKIEANLGAQVRLNSDHEASAALKGCLDWADVVICVTRAAQHAATNEIDRRVPEEVLIRPPGKGSSSIWNELMKWRQGQFASLAGV